MKIPFEPWKQCEIKNVPTDDLEMILEDKVPYKLRHAIVADLKRRDEENDHFPTHYDLDDLSWDMEAEEKDREGDYGDIEDTMWCYSYHW